MPKRQHQPLSVGKLLHQQQFSNIEQEINHKQALQHCAAEILSRFKLACCQAKSGRPGVVMIEAPNGTWLNRLKQFRHQLLSEFRQAMPGVVSLDFSVNPRLASIKPEAKEKITAKRQISPTAAKHITEMAEQLPGELGEKLKKLAALGGEK